MLSRVFNVRRKKRNNLKWEGNNSSSLSQNPDTDELEVYTRKDDLPLSFCERSVIASRGLGLRAVLQSSVQVLGESGLGISEKVVMNPGEVFAAKRFRKVYVSKVEFSRRVEKLAHVSRGCEYLVPLKAYLYTKRLKLVLCDYYPMGSLADLLAGARGLDHTPLDWPTRAMIVFHVAKALAFIHNQFHPQEKHLQVNVHGNIKASNVFIKTDFSACVSDYGFVQLAEQVDVAGVQHRTLPEIPIFANKLSQKADIYNFGVLMLDILGGEKAPYQISSIRERKEELKDGRIGFFEFSIEGRARKQALQVLEIALACTNRCPEARPDAVQIVGILLDILRIK